MTIAVRPATHDDLPGILEIYNHAVAHSTATADYEPHTLETRTAWFADRTEKGFPIYVAVDSEIKQIVGWSAYGPYHARIGYRFTVENSVYVHVDWRGQGVGKLLLKPLIEHATQHGFHSILASIDGNNEASIHLHTAFGFTQVARLKDAVYKFDTWLDVVYMQLLLTKSA